MNPAKFFVLCLVSVALAAKINHVIVLMQENRSFDHILGFMKENTPAIDGCLPDMGKVCSNPMDPQDPTSQWVPVNNQAAEHQVSDPDHSNEGTTREVYGFGDTSVEPAPMTGFIKNYAHKEVIMECFPPELVPAMSTLASEFALFDRWYSSVPGPTEVNRMFLYSATSDGSANNDDVHLALGYPQRTIFENIDESKYNRTWGVYFQEAPSVFFMKYVRTEENLKKFHSYEKFLEDAKAGTLPSFTFIEPNYSDLPGKPATDQHPDHDVGLGDQLIKEIYEAVRNGPLWNDSLLLITYDEHGGFFDHVPPPINIPSPDGKVSHDSDPSFDFTRLGVRVPAIAISPWISKGLLVHEPGNNTHYEHSSLSATLLKLLTPDQTFLTKRDAWAAPFDWLLDTEATLRTDCPTELPTAPTDTRTNGVLLPLDQIGSRPITPLQQTLVKVASGLKNKGVITHTGEGMSEADGAYFLKDRVNEWLGREVVNFHRPAEAAPVLSQA